MPDDLVKRLREVTENDAYASPWTFGETCKEAADRITALEAALWDMHQGWLYIRHRYGDLDGVGWDRCDQAARALLNKEKKE